MAVAATKIQTHWDWQRIVSQIPNRQTTPVFHPSIYPTIYKHNIKRFTIVKRITDTSHILIRNPNDTRLFATTTRSQRKIQIKKAADSQTPLPDSHKQTSQLTVSVSHIIQLFKARTHTNTHKYNRDPSPKYDWLLARLVQPHFVCKPHHRLDLRP